MSKETKKVTRDYLWIATATAVTGIGIANLISNWRRRNAIRNAENEKKLKQIKKPTNKKKK